MDSTLDVDYFKASGAEQAQPGLLLVHSVDAPRCGPIPLENGTRVIGRGSVPGVELEDRTLSRQHVRVTFSGGAFTVEDLGSKSGFVLDGVPVGSKATSAPGGRVLRVGHTVFMLLPDIRLYLGKPLTMNGAEVLGPVLAHAWEAVANTARTSSVLHLQAESGAGKELAARRFHAASPRARGPFVAVNCASIPQGVAERLLFGALKGSFSGAVADALGYFEAAHGGTLFLDEVAELDLEVQAKLLRALETREVLPVGALKPRPVELGVVSATHVDLKQAIAQKRFREDLFFRLGKPSVDLPPLRQRPEEIGFHAAAAAARIAKGLRLSAGLIEACLLREWPGNVRELILEVEDAARGAQLDGATEVDAAHLDPDAGRRAEAIAAEPAAPGSAPRTLPADDVIADALRAAGGKVATAARALGVHRNQLRRWLALHPPAAS